jgi:hexosaminidase
VHYLGRERLTAAGVRVSGRFERGLIAGALLVALLGGPLAAQSPAPPAPAAPASSLVSPAAQEAQAPGLARLDLLPWPASISLQPGRLALDSTFTWAIAGSSTPRLLGAVSRALRRLEGRTGLILPRQPAADTAVPTLTIGAGEEGMPVQGVAEDESYTLEVGAQHAVLAARTEVGIIRGLETFLQLVQGDREGWSLPLVSIADRPRFPWRGLLIDVSRHWEPPAVIERNLDAMAAVKLNVLHWHLSDDQGFRVESRRYPLLQDSGSDGSYYTQERVRAIVAYARDRGIRVVPEFDMPAHTQSWFVGYPRYASAPGPYHVAREFGVHDAVFDPTREEVYRFIEGFVAEMAALFPDAYWHVGGDEANGKQWSANPAVQAFIQRRDLKDNAGLQAHFNRRLRQILTRHGKRMVGWDEILHPDLPKTIVIQSWRGVASLAAAARQGFDAILSSGYYLDAMSTAAAHYLVDPLPDSLGLEAAQAAHLLGGEACMWGEAITPETIDSRIWPRTAAMAERFWSPRAVADPGDMYRRLAVVSGELEELGISTESHAARMLARIAPGLDPAPLETLLSVASPASLGGRRFVSQQMQFIPLSAVSEAARPDPPAAREVAAEVRALLLDLPRFAGYRASLAERFREWRDAEPAIAALAEGSPMVAEALPVAQDLADLGAAGLEALAYLEAGTVAPAAWKADRVALLQRVAQPKANLRLMVVPALRELIGAASNVRP